MASSSTPRRWYQSRRGFSCDSSAGAGHQKLLQSDPGAQSYIVEDDQIRGPTPFNVADGVEKAMIVERRNQLLQEQR